MLKSIESTFSRLAKWARLNRNRQANRLKDDLDYFHRDRDPKENADTAPPEGESIDLHCIWVGEIYLASQLHDLHDGLEKLGWLRASRDYSPMNDLESWLGRNAISLTGSAWYNLGIVTRPGENRFVSRDLHAPLPDIVDYASGGIHYIGPGLLEVVLQFVLTDAGAKSIEHDLRYSRSTYMVSHGNRTSIIGPRNQKIESTRVTRRESRRKCATWFKEYLPGFFTTLDESLSMPTAEFLMFKKAKSFEQDANGEWGNYLQVLNLSHDFHVYESSQLPGVTLSYTSDEPGKPLALVLAASEEKFGDMDDSNWESHGGKNRRGYTNWLRYFESTFVVWTLQGLVGKWEEGYASLRNRLAEVELGKPKRAALQLQDCQKSLVELSRGAIPVATMLRDRLRENGWFRNEEYEFTLVDKDRQQGPPLFESIRDSVATRSGEILAFEDGLSRIAVSQAALVNTIAQSRTNTNLVKLTWALVILTAAILILSAEFVGDKLGEFKEFIDGL